MIKLYIRRRSQRSLVARRKERKTEQANNNANESDPCYSMVTVVPGGRRFMGKQWCIVSLQRMQGLLPADVAQAATQGPDTDEHALRFRFPYDRK